MKRTSLFTDFEMKKKRKRQKICKVTEKEDSTPERGIPDY